MRKRTTTQVLISAAIGVSLIFALDLRADVIPYGSFTGTLITFDNLAGSPTLGAGEVLTNQYAGLGVTFQVPNFNAYASNGVLATGSSLTSLPNVIWVNQGGGSGGSSAQGMDILFSTPHSAVGLYFEASCDSTVTLAVYNGATLLESVTSSLQPGGLCLEGYLALADSNITSAIVYSTNDHGQNWNFSIDNLKFGQVPEPATVSMVAAGLLGFATAVRRKLLG